MMFKSHLAVGVLLMLVFLPVVSSRLIFIPVVLLASILPDIDSAYSYLGKKKIFRPLQALVKHRGVIHSLSLAVLVSLVFAFYVPVLALPFFLGYAGHLFVDSLTPEGIRPFWPLKKEVKGRIRVGRSVERGVFVVFITVDVILFVMLFL